MFSETASSRRAPVILVLCAVLLLGVLGCEKEEVIDPYVYTTIKGVMDGDTLSARTVGSMPVNGYFFEIDAPEVLEFARGDVGLVRHGNRLDFMIAPDIENNFASYRGKILGVEKRFTHGVNVQHLFVKHVKDGTTVTPVDSVETYTLPNIFTLSDQQNQLVGQNFHDMDYVRTTTFEPFMPKNEGDAPIESQFVAESFVKAQIHDISEQDLANPDIPHDAWYIKLDKITMQVVDLDASAEYMLEMLAEQGNPIWGSFSLISFEEGRAERYATFGDLGHVCAKVRINWFKFGKKAVLAS